MSWYFRSTLLVALLLAGTNGCTRKQSALSQRELAMRVLGEFIRTNAAPNVVLVIGNPLSRSPGRPPQVYEYQSMSVEGLRTGLESKVELREAFPELKPEFLADPQSVYVEPRTTTPLSYLITEQAFDLLAKQHPDAAVFVSLIGIPANLASVQAWQNPNSPSFALLLPDWRMIGGPAQIAAAFESGKLLAAIIARPGANEGGKMAGADPRKRFEAHFILVTRANVSEVMGQFPALFSP